MTLDKADELGHDLLRLVEAIRAARALREQSPNPEST